MRILRYSTPSGPRWGLLDSTQTEVLPITGAIATWAEQVTAGQAPPTENTPIPFDSIELLPPVEASSQIVALGMNYPATAPPQHAQSVVYTKANSSLASPGAELRYPDLMVAQPQLLFGYSAELVAVIGTTYPRNELAGVENVLGYTIANNGLLRHLKPSFVAHDMFGSASAFQSSSIGPWIVTRDEIPADHPALTIRARIDGAVVDETSTTDMINDLAGSLREVSIRTRLSPGDLVLTGGGTPEDNRHGLYRAGERVEIEIEPIGTLTNTLPEADNYRMGPPLRWAGPKSMSLIHPATR